AGEASPERHPSTAGCDGRLQPTQDAGAVDVAGAAHFERAIALAAALQPVTRIDEDVRGREEVDGHVIFEACEGADVLSVPLIEGHAPLDGHARLGHALHHAREASRAGRACPVAAWRSSPRRDP